MKNTRSTFFSVSIAAMLVAFLPPAQADDDTLSTMLQTLQAEKQRYSQLTQQLQESIRAATRTAAAHGAIALTEGDGLTIGVTQAGSLKRDVIIEESKLTAMQASRQAVIDRFNQPGDIPPSVLAQLDPEIVQLRQQRDFLVQQRDTRASAARNPESDPRQQQMNQQINDIDKRIGEIVENASEERKQAIQNNFRVTDEINLFLLDHKIREQEILVETLTRKYHEQLAKNAERAAEVIDISFDQAQLQRVNRILEQIDGRIFAIQSRQGEVLPSAENVPNDPGIQAQIDRIIERLDQLESRLAPQPEQRAVQQPATPQRTLQRTWRSR